MLSDSLRTVYKTILSSQSRRFMTASAKLDALSPLKVLSRGYSITQKDNRIVTSVKEIKPDDKLTLVLADGEVSCIAERTKENTDEEKT